MIAIPVLALLAGLLGQGTQPERQVGVVRKTDTAARELTFALDTGEERRIVVSPEISLVRVAPGEPDLSKAAKIALENVAAGDRVLVRGARTGDGQFVAVSIVVISGPDLVRKREAERAEWRRRGISGRVEAVHLASGQIIVIVPAVPQPRTLTLRLSQGASQKRYRPDSARFSDAVPSTLEDIRVGDQIHALGDLQGEVFEAQQIVSGSFRNFAALIEAIDAAKRLVLVKDLERKRTVSLLIEPGTALRRITPEAARRLTAAPSDVRTIIERLPVLGLADLKPGEAVIVASTRSAADTVPAITLLGGAEPLLTKASGAQRNAIGSWNLTLDPTQP